MSEEKAEKPTRKEKICRNFNRNHFQGNDFNYGNREFCNVSTNIVNKFEISKEIEIQ